MAPYITILIFGIIGYLTFGIYGALIGAVVGYATSFLIGTIANKTSGGLVPQKAKAETAAYMMMKHGELVKEFYSSDIRTLNEKHNIEMSDAVASKYIMDIIEDIYRYSSKHSSSINSEWISLPSIKKTFEHFIAQENTPKGKLLLKTLYECLVDTQYKKKS